VTAWPVADWEGATASDTAAAASPEGDYMVGREGNVKQRGLRHVVAMATCALMIVTMMLGGARVVAQDTASTPGAETEAGQGVAGLQPAVTPTPVVGSTSGEVQAPATATGTESLPSAPTGPVASATEGDMGAPVLAQGLVYLTGDNVIWQVREVTLAGTETVSGNARVILQRAGTTIVRTDVSGKRTRLEPGEAFFAAAGDSYTTAPEGSGGSTVWVFEVSNSNQVGEGAFYLSPDVAGYAEGTYDFEFTRYVVPAGGSADFLGGTGPSLLLVVAGSVEVTLEDEVAALSARDGLVVDSSAVIGAPSGDAVVVAVTIGPAVTGDTIAAQSPASGPPTGNPGAAAPAAPAAPAPASGENGAFVTSIQVGAVEGIAVTVYVDGQIAFDGWLEAGQWTDFVTGSVFEVYTSSGVNTQFINSCNEQFTMGTEPGEAQYVLTASASSCAPV
jgi:hypothetical protein